jgi:hypothetical protein
MIKRTINTNALPDSPAKLAKDYGKWWKGNEKGRMSIKTQIRSRKGHNTSMVED